MTATPTQKKARHQKNTPSIQRRASATATAVVVVSYNPRMVKKEAIEQQVKAVHGVNTVRTHNRG